MKNKERIQSASTKELASIIVKELCGMCHVCKYCLTPDCRFDEEAEEANPGACEEGIAEWLENETEAAVERNHTT